MKRWSAKPGARLPAATDLPGTSHANTNISEPTTTPDDPGSINPFDTTWDLVSSTVTDPRYGVISGVIGFAFFGVISAPIEVYAGGVFGLVIYAALVRVVFWFLKRARQRRIEKEFDGNFDLERFTRPAAGDKGGTIPSFGSTGDDDGVGGRLGASAMGRGVISPYALYQPTGGSSPPHSAGSPPPMSQYSHNDATTTPSGYTPYSNNTHVSYGRYSVANADENYMGAGPGPRSNAVLVHQDGGSLSQQGTPEDEIPPSYDSLPGSVLCCDVQI